METTGPASLHAGSPGIAGGNLTKQTGLRRVTAVLVIGTGSALCAAPAAQAQSPLTTCHASALGVSLFGGPAIQPIQASSGPACGESEGVLDLAALGALNADVIRATTTGTSRTAAATGRVTDLDLGAYSVVGGLSASLLTGTDSVLPGLESQLAGLTGTGGLLYNVLAPLRGLGLEVVGTDTAVLNLAAQGNLPGALQLELPDVISADVIEARAAATCSAGRAVLAGDSTISGLRVLGSQIDIEGAADQLLSIDTANLNLGQLLTIETILRSVRVRATTLSPLSLVVGTGERSLYDLLITPGGLLGAVNGLLTPLGTSLGSIVTGVTGTLQPVLDSVQINLPPGLLRATVTPRGEARDAETLTTSAVDVSVTALGQPVLAGRLAEARATIRGLDCTEDPDGPIRDVPRREPDGNTPQNPDLYGTRAGELALQCDGAKLRLIDVRRSGGRTLVRGYAQRQLAGETVAVRLRGKSRAVGRTTVRADGTFAVRVALPPKQIRHTSKARYFAIIEAERTKALKFARRMQVLEASSSKSKVTFTGRVTSPRPKVARTVRIQERVSCGQYRTVARVKPNKAGRYTATFNAPANQSMAVYRAVSEAPTSAPSRRLHPTYTLPKIIALKNN